MNTKLAKTRTFLLLVSGVVLMTVGGIISVSPLAFYASNDIDPGGSVSLLNELKAPAGLLLVLGAFMVSALFMRSRADPALWLAALVYLSYAISRAVSMIMDGRPAEGLVQAAVLEGVIGLACLAVALLRRVPAGRGA